MHGGLNAPWWFVALTVLLLAVAMGCAAWTQRAKATGNGWHTAWAIAATVASAGAALFCFLVIAVLKGWL